MGAASGRRHGATVGSGYGERLWGAAIGRRYWDPVWERGEP